MGRGLRELFPHSLLLNCLQLKIAVISKGHMLGWHTLVPSTPVLPPCPALVSGRPVCSHVASGEVDLSLTPFLQSALEIYVGVL